MDPGPNHNHDRLATRSRGRAGRDPLSDGALKAAIGPEPRLRVAALPRGPSGAPKRRARADRPRATTRHHGSRSHAVTRRVCFLAAALLLPSCSRAPFAGGEARAPGERSAAIEDGARGSADAGASAATGETRVIRYWVAGCSVSEDLWRHRKSSTVTCDERGRYLDGPQGTLLWPDYLDAAELDTLTIEGEALDTVRFELGWSDDDAFPPERRVTPSAGASTKRSVRFDLAGSPEWKGRVRRLRLEWSGTPSPATRVLAARGLLRGSGVAHATGDPAPASPPAESGAAEPPPGGR